MRSLGVVLRQAREQQGRSLASVADATCISSRYLTAIENDDAKVLPNRFFHRNFVKQYASCLGLETASYMKMFDRQFLPEPEEAPVEIPRGIRVVEALQTLRPRLLWTTSIGMLVIAGGLFFTRSAESKSNASAAKDTAPKISAKSPAGL